MKSMEHVSRLYKAGALISFISMILVVVLQVFTRYFLESAPHWTEELARIFFIYSVAFGTGTGIHNGDFIRLDLIQKYLSRRVERVLNIVTDSAVVVFALLLIAGSYDFIKLGMDELSPALRITMGFVFLSIFFIGLAIVLYTLAHLLEILKTKA